MTSNCVRTRVLPGGPTGNTSATRRDRGSDLCAWRTCAARSVAVWGTGREGRAAVTAIAAHGPSRLLAVDDSANFLSVPWEGELAAAGAAGRR